MPARARVAVIGTGWWATTVHIPALQQHDTADLVALCDQDGQRLRAAAEAYDVEGTYDDVEALLAGETLDGVIVATNHASHHAVARRCLDAGLHVMVEKPLTLRAAEARDLVDTARRQGRELLVGYPYNFTPYARRARAAVAAGDLGPIQYVSCVFSSHIIGLLRGRHEVKGPVHGPGAVYSDPALSGGGHGHLQMTHPLGLLCFVSGLRARRVHALMARHGLALDLVDAMTVEFETGALASIGGTGNLGGGGRKHDLQIYAEAGAIDIDVCTGVATLHRHGRPPEPIEPVVGEDQYPRASTANNLVDVILGRAPNGSPGEVGWRAVEILEGAYRSAAEDGRGVNVEELYAA